MKKAKNAISREEVNEVIKQAHRSFDGYANMRFNHSFEKLLWAHLSRRYPALDSEVNQARLDVFNNPERIPAFLNFITKDDSV